MLSHAIIKLPYDSSETDGWNSGDRAKEMWEAECSQEVPLAKIDQFIAILHFCQFDARVCIYGDNISTIHWAWMRARKSFGCRGSERKSLGFLRA